MGGLPLEGSHVLVTRPAGQAGGLGRRLERHGARVTALPTIRIVDPPDGGPLDRAAAGLESYDWVILTSVNGVERLAAALERLGRGMGPLARVRIGVIGPATGRAVRALGAAPIVMPDSFRGERLAEAVIAAAEDVSGARILLARAREARPALPDRLRAAGASVDVVAAYETRVNRDIEPDLTRLLDEGAFDWITFTASSTVRAYAELAGIRTGGARIAAIGPITARTVRDLGLPVDAVADTYTTGGLVEALVREARDRGAGAGREAMP